MKLNAKTQRREEKNHKGSLWFLSSRLCAFAFSFLILNSCSWQPCSESYRELYQHAQRDVRLFPTMQESEYYIVFLVDAHHLDYTDNRSFLKTLVKHPSSGSKNGDVGHAWIYLRSPSMVIEGGHSGEFGIVQEKYLDGVMNNIEFGYANPTQQQKFYPRYEPNPIKYLWETLYDGIFQHGAGGHTPTFAAKIDLSQEQYEIILDFISRYPYQEYSLTGNQCTSFIVQIADLIDLPLDSVITIQIDPYICIGNDHLLLWTDASYSY
jgi:hypothetical protein